MTITSINEGRQEIKKNFENARGKESMLAEEILDGSREKAAGILALHGFSNYEHDGFIKDREVCSFYGVSSTYFLGILSRFKLCPKNYPLDMRKRSGSFEPTVSARMMLALSAYMFAGRNIPEESKAMEVYKYLLKTDYYTKAMEKLKAARKSRQDVRRGKMRQKSLLQRHLRMIQTWWKLTVREEW